MRIEIPKPTNGRCHVAQRLWLAFGLVLCEAFLVGCGGASTGQPKGPSEAAERDRTIRHEACDVAGPSAELIDANGDTKPDVAIAKSGSRELCRGVDLDFDGKMDLWTYLDGQGTTRRRELDFDHDGEIDEIQLFVGGVLSEKQRTTTRDRFLDTWETYRQGKLVKAERDSDGDGRIDQWWDFASPECPKIRSDLDRNGTPDAKAMVDYCKESGYRPEEPTELGTNPTMRKDLPPAPTEREEDGEAAAPAIPYETSGSVEQPARGEPSSSSSRGAGK